MASQIRAGTSVFMSQKYGKAKSMQKIAPPMYTGLRPTRSESDPKNGMRKNSREAPIEHPD